MVRTNVSEGFASSHASFRLLLPGHFACTVGELRVKLIDQDYGGNEEWVFWDVKGPYDLRHQCLS